MTIKNESITVMQMNIWLILGELFFGALILFFFIYFIYSLLEKEKRAARINFFIFCILIILNILILLLDNPLKNWLLGSAFITGMLVSLLLIVFPPKKQPIKIVGRQHQIDERDTIFARFDLKEGTDIFNDYYRRRPEYRDIDAEIRKLPDILTPSHLKKNPVLLSLARAEFTFLEDQISNVTGEINPHKIELSPYDNTHAVKKIINYLGSEICGIVKLEKAYVYSNAGRGPEPYGKKIKLDHTYAVAFAVEMDVRMISDAPHPPVIVETGKQYVEAARISTIVSHFIRERGYSARAHIAGSNYQALLPPLAWKAGLGELGRLGILITWKYGPRARLGLVTTNMPLVPDKPRIFGIQNFCQKCNKCARNCPAQAIPYGEVQEENGVLKWTINREECYKYWRKSGTDCAVCLSVCPYSKPDNLFHLMIRNLISHSAPFQTASVWGDDFLYGRNPLRDKKSRFNLNSSSTNFPVFK